MCHAFLESGRGYSFKYPRHNYRQLPTVTESRRIVVSSIRDMHDKPLDRMTETGNPLLKRSRWLITSTDLDKDVERSFYLESMTNIQALTDDELQPLKGVEYIVVQQHRVTYKTQKLLDALVFREECQSGVICAVLSSGPGDVCLDPTKSDLECPFIDDAEFDWHE